MDIEKIISQLNADIEYRIDGNGHYKNLRVYIVLEEETCLIIDTSKKEITMYHNYKKDVWFLPADANSIINSAFEKIYKKEVLHQSN